MDRDGGKFLCLQSLDLRFIHQHQWGQFSCSFKYHIIYSWHGQKTKSKYWPIVSHISISVGWVVGKPGLACLSQYWHFITSNLATHHTVWMCENSNPVIKLLNWWSKVLAWSCHLFDWPNCPIFPSFENVWTVLYFSRTLPTKMLRRQNWSI